MKLLNCIGLRPQTGFRTETTLTSETRELHLRTSEPGDMDIAVDLAVKLGLSSAGQVMNTFQQLAKNESLSKFLMVTITMPFFLTYSTGKVVVLVEVDLELRLNTLVNLLLTDPSFSSVRSASEFEAKGASLWDERKEEVEEKKQWAIDLQKSR